MPDNVSGVRDVCSHYRRQCLSSPAKAPRSLIKLALKLCGGGLPNLGNAGKTPLICKEYSRKPVIMFIIRPNAVLRTKLVSSLLRPPAGHTSQGGKRPETKTPLFGERVLKILSCDTRTHINIYMLSIPAYRHGSLLPCR